MAMRAQVYAQAPRREGFHCREESCCFPGRKGTYSPNFETKWKSLFRLAVRSVDNSDFQRIWARLTLCARPNVQTGKSDILGSFHPTVPNDRDLLIRETSLDTLRFIFKLAEQGYQLQLSVKEQVERKATSMIGFAGLAVTIETSILSELGRQTKSTFIDKFTVGVFVASLSLIIASCVCSFLVTRVYSYSSP